MFHACVLKSESTARFYVGPSGGVHRRLSAHNANLAPATKNRGPWQLVYQESHPTRAEAVKWERCLSTGKGREELRRILKEAPARSTGRGRHGTKRDAELLSV